MNRPFVLLAAGGEAGEHSQPVVLPMRITDVQVILIYPRLARRYDDRKMDMVGMDHRVVYKVQADNGLVGYGDTRVRPGWTFDPSAVKPFIGRDPFDYINHMTGGALCGALYDLMG